MLLFPMRPASCSSQEWQLEAKLQGHAKAVTALAALDAQTLASASHDHTLKLWDLAARRCIATLTGHTDEALQAERYGPGERQPGQNSARLGRSHVPLRGDDGRPY